MLCALPLPAGSMPTGFPTTAPRSVRLSPERSEVLSLGWCSEGAVLPIGTIQSWRHLDDA